MKLCKLARGFKAKSHKRSATCNWVESPQTLIYQLPKHCPRLDVKVATVYATARQEQNFAAVQVRFTSSEEVSRLCTWCGKGRIFLLCPAIQYGPLYTACPSQHPQRYWCQLWSVSFVTSVVPTTCPTQPCNTHYVNLQCNCHNPRCCKMHLIHRLSTGYRQGTESNPQNYRQHLQLNVSGPFTGKVTSWSF